MTPVELTRPASPRVLEVDDLERFTTLATLIGHSAGAQRVSLDVHATDPHGRVRRLSMSTPPRADDDVAWAMQARWRGRKGRREVGRGHTPPGSTAAGFLRGGVEAIEQFTKRMGRPLRFTGDLEALGAALELAQAQSAAQGAES